MSSWQMTHNRKFDAFKRHVKFKIFRRVQIMILFPKRILPGVSAVDYRPHWVLISAQTLMGFALLQTANAYDYTYVTGMVCTNKRPSCVLLSYKQQTLWLNTYLLEWFAVCTNNRPSCVLLWYKRKLIIICWRSKQESLMCCTLQQTKRAYSHVLVALFLQISIAEPFWTCHR